MAASSARPISMDSDNLRRVPTNGSLTAIDEDHAIGDDPEHKQDWTVTTDEKDSWANRERRRSSIWGKVELVPASTSPKSSAAAPRRGSILSMWQGGKDKNGRDILAHDDHPDSDTEQAESVGSPVAESQQQAEAIRERRGSILSMWKKGKDEHGRDTIAHDDEEWKV